MLRPLLLAVAVLFVAGCGPEGDDGVKPCPPGQALQPCFDIGSNDSGKPDAGGSDAGSDGGTGVRRITSVSIEPTALQLEMGQVARVYAYASWSDGTESDVSGSVIWTLSPASGVVDLRVVSLQDGVVVIDTVGAGQTQLVASTGSVFAAPCPIEVAPEPVVDAGPLPLDAGPFDAGGSVDAGDSGSPNDAGNLTDAGARDGGSFDAGSPDAGSPDAGQVPKEYRAVWITRFTYASANPVASRNQVVSLINKAADAGFNVVYFQIRGEGDAYYRSDLAPWAKSLTGTLGKPPTFADGGLYDPLQVAIDTAHARGIELHAYWNVFSGWRTPSGCKTSGTACRCVPAQDAGIASCVLPEPSFDGGPSHILREHPEYIAVTTSGESIDQEYYWITAGNPAARTRLVAEADELLQRYDVDGLHLDRIRYPGQTYSHDQASEIAYAALPGSKPSYADWQRAMVTDTVARIYTAMKQRRPNAVLSASVWGIYKPLPGCNTSQGYGNYFQDSVGWMDAGVIDALTPMIYWDIGTGCTDWAKLLDGFLASRNGRPIIAGMHALEADDSLRMNRINARVQYARQKGAAGTSIFASVYLDANGPGDSLPDHPEAWPLFRADGGVYVRNAETPEIDWR